MLENYRGIPCESESEIDIADWLLELKDRGLILDIIRGAEMLIYPGLTHNYILRTEMKTKVKEEPKSQTILEPHYYTPEFIVKWNSNPPRKLLDHVPSTPRKLESLLIADPWFEAGIPEAAYWITYIEVKPDFDSNNMTRLFRVNQKWAWEERGMFINLLQPHKLFKTTFTPEVYLQTRKRRTERKISWKIITVDEYLKSIGYINETPIPQSLENRPHQE